MKRSYLGPCLMVVTVCLAASLAAAQSIAGSAHSELTFSIPGQGQRTPGNYLGRVLALEFINTKCSHCQATSQVMTHVQQQLGSDGFQALGIAVNDDAASLVSSFVADYHINFPVGWTSYNQMLSYMGYTERADMPQLVLIDRAGKIRYRTPRTGDPESLKEEVIVARVRELLSRK